MQCRLDALPGSATVREAVTREWAQRQVIMHLIALLGLSLILTAALSGNSTLPGVLLQTEPLHLLYSNTRTFICIWSHNICFTCLCRCSDNIPGWWLLFEPRVNNHEITSPHSSLIYQTLQCCQQTQELLKPENCKGRYAWGVCWPHQAQSQNQVWGSAAIL